MTNKTVHELRVMPFHVERDWYAIEDANSPPVQGNVVLYCTDGVEREGNVRDRDIHLKAELPDGVTATHWRLP